MFPSDPPSVGIVIGFSILCAVAFLCSVRAFYLGKTRSHYGNFVSARYLFPLNCLIMSIENAALAASGRFYTDTVEENKLVQAVFAMQAMEAPILLIVAFELTYLVHKRRSVNFCGMYFDEGRRVNKTITTPIKSFLLRNLIRILAIFLFAMGIVGNFDLTGELTTVNELAGRAGWWSLVKDPRPWDEKWPLLLSLLPTAVLALCSFYFSFLLWRYGTESSIVVHSSVLNPWFNPFFGTVALAAGQVAPEEWYPLTSNIGLLIFVITLLLLMAEVDKDMVAADNFGVFLTEVAAMGDKITVRRVMEEDTRNEDSMIEDSFVVNTANGGDTHEVVNSNTVNEQPGEDEGNEKNVEEGGMFEEDTKI